MDLLKTHQFIVRFLLISLLHITHSDSTDLTIEPRTTGEDVVLAAYSKIRNLFADDHRFLIRAAYVESKFGTYNETFRDGYFGGIWQIGEEAFKTTKSLETYPQLHTRYKQFQDAFGIDWSAVEWEDLLKPFYSLLAANLKLFLVGLKVPQNVEDQARFWKMHFNEQTRSANDFVNSVRQLEDCSVSKIKCRIDLVIVMDASGSIGIDGYEKAKKFVIELLECMPTDTVQTGLLIFSEEVEGIFNLTSELTQEQKKLEISGAKYPGLGTNTYLGMNLASEWLRKRQETYKEDIPPVMLVLTDGQSSDSQKTRSAAFNAQQLGVTAFAVGIGNYIKRAELKLIAGQSSSPNEQVMQINTYQTLSELLVQIQNSVCSTARRLRRDVRVKENVRQNEVSYYASHVPPSGIVISMETPLGKTKGFYSFHTKTPSEVYNDGEIHNGFNYIPSPPLHQQRSRHLRSKREIKTHHHHPHRHWRHSQSEHRNRYHTTSDLSQIFIAIEGIQSLNNFTIEIEDNNDSSAMITTTTQIFLAEPTTESPGYATGIPFTAFETSSRPEIPKSSQLPGISKNILKSASKTDSGINVKRTDERISSAELEDDEALWIIRVQPKSSSTRTDFCQFSFAFYFLIFALNAFL